MYVVAKLVILRWKDKSDGFMSTFTYMYCRLYFTAKMKYFHHFSFWTLIAFDTMRKTFKALKYSRTVKNLWILAFAIPAVLFHISLYRASALSFFERILFTYSAKEIRDHFTYIYPCIAHYAFFFYLFLTASSYIFSPELTYVLLCMYRYIWAYASHWIEISAIFIFIFVYIIIVFISFDIFRRRIKCRMCTLRLQRRLDAPIRSSQTLLLYGD